MSENFIPLKLPSKCKTYVDVDASQVAIRVLKGKDEKLIAEMTFDNLDRKFVVVLRNVMKGIDPAKLTLGDRKFVLVWLAINSYSKDFTIEAVCEHCLQKITTTIDLSTFEVNELPDGYKQPYTVKLKDGSDVNLRLLTVEDELKVVEHEKSGANGWLYRYALSIEDSTKSLAEKLMFLEDLNVNELATIRVFHEKYDHGPVMEAKYECPKCGGTGLTAVPFRIEMVFPYGKTLRSNFGATV